MLIAPVIPGLTDHEMPAILETAARAGARYCGYEVLRLPHSVAGLSEGGPALSPAAFRRPEGPQLGLGFAWSPTP